MENVHAVIFFRSNFTEKYPYFGKKSVLQKNVYNIGPRELPFASVQQKTFFLFYDIILAYFILGDLNPKLLRHRRYLITKSNCKMFFRRHFDIYS